MALSAFKLCIFIPSTGSLAVSLSAERSLYCFETLLYCQTLQRRSKWIKKDINNTLHLQLSQTLCRWTVADLRQSSSHSWGLNLGSAVPAAQIPAACSGSKTLGFAFPQVLFVEIVLSSFLFHQEWLHCELKSCSVSILDVATHQNNLRKCQVHNNGENNP